MPRQAARAMMRAPSLAAIYAAEMGFAKSRLNARDSLRGARVALRATLARPATLALVAGAAGVLGFWLARRPRPQAKSATGDASVATKTSLFALALPFIARYATPGLPIILQRGLTALLEARREPSRRAGITPAA